MSAAIATTRDSRWLYSRLSPIGPKVYPDRVPQGVTTKAIVYRQLGNADLMTVGRTFMVRSVWLVFVSAANTNKLQLEADAEAIHDAIYKPTPTTVSGRIIHECIRESEHDVSTVEEGTTYQQLGGIYRIYSTEVP